MQPSGTKPPQFHSTIHCRVLFYHGNKQADEIKCRIHNTEYAEFLDNSTYGISLISLMINWILLLVFPEAMLDISFWRLKNLTGHSEDTQVLSHIFLLLPTKNLPYLLIAKIDTCSWFALSILKCSVDFKIPSMAN